MDPLKLWIRPFWVLTVLIILSLVALGRACIFRPSTNFSGEHFNQGTNAIWLDVDWVMEPHRSDEVASLADELARREVRNVFVFVSYLKSDGDFNPTYSYAADFVRAIKAAQPHLNVQAWIGLPLTESGLFPPPGHVDLRDQVTRQRIVEFSAVMVGRVGFDGIHLDPEPIRSGNADVLALLEEIRDAIGPQSTRSMAGRRIRPFRLGLELPFTDTLAWHASYYREVAKRVDQVAVMTYDSYLPFPELYRQWVRFQVIEASQALDGLAVDLLVGVPTSEERTASHWPSAENLLSGLLGVTDGLNDLATRPSVVTGVAVYPHWETDADEWADYESLWLGR